MAALKADFQKHQARARDVRSPERLSAHYDLETGLANRLREATAEDRAVVYGEVYRDLMNGLPDHPMHTRPPEHKDNLAARHVRRLRSFLAPHAIYLEIGCGDATGAFAVAGHLKEAIGLDVNDALIDMAKAPANFRFVKTSGIAMNLPDDAIDVAHSTALIEHLHPDDVVAQIAEVRRVLKPGGRYYCRTPNRVLGPHDVSIYFSDVAHGMHLKEYDNRTLADMFKAAGYSRADTCLVVKGIVLPRPLWLVSMAEWLVEHMPNTWRRRLARSTMANILLNVDVIGMK